MTHLISHYGLWFLFGIVALESAGAWLPGETALIAAGVYASNGHLSIVGVVVVAAVAAIAGDNVGYWIGREGGRRLAMRLPWLRRAVPFAETFFERHGGKTVFFGRWFAGLRVTAAWLAGITRMPWWRFFGWNASGGILWATTVGLVAYYAGKAVANTISRYGVYGGVALAVLIVFALAGLHFWRRSAVESS